MIRVQNNASSFLAANLAQTVPSQSLSYAKIFIPSSFHFFSNNCPKTAKFSLVEFLKQPNPIQFALVSNFVFNPQLNTNLWGLLPDKNPTDDRTIFHLGDSYVEKAKCHQQTL